MKATGIVRRIDPLGRVVIPKEIRRTLRIDEGTPIEILVEQDGVILRKYSPIKELGEFAQEYAEALITNARHTVLICDKDVVVGSSGQESKQYRDKKISTLVKECSDGVGYILNNESSKDSFVEGMKELDACYIIQPIRYEGHSVGSVVIISKGEKLGLLEIKLAEVAGRFLAGDTEIRVKTSNIMLYFYNKRD